MALMKKIGHYAFLIGILLAVVLALFVEQIGTGTSSTMLLVLVILGVIVGFLNIQHKEMTEFLVAAITLIVMAPLSIVFSSIPLVGGLIKEVLTYIAIFVAPAALIVALKAIVELAEKE